MTRALLALFTVVGGVVTTTATAAFAYYVVTRRPTPDMKIRDAIREIRWSYALAFFVLPCAGVAILEGFSLPLALAYGFALPVLMVLFAWWGGPI